MWLSQVFQLWQVRPNEKFHLIAIIDAIPTQLRHHLKTCNNKILENSPKKARALIG